MSTLRALHFCILIPDSQQPSQPRMSVVFIWVLLIFGTVLQIDARGGGGRGGGSRGGGGGGRGGGSRGWGSFFGWGSGKGVSGVVERKVGYFGGRNVVANYKSFKGPSRSSSSSTTGFGMGKNNTPTLLSF